MTQITTTPEQEQDWLSRPLLAAMTIDWEKVIYITFIATAILTRFIGLGSRVMSHDESLHTQFSYQFYDGQGFSHTPLMHGPFLFHITAVSYWLFGDNDFTSRMPVAILGVILVAMPYFLRRWLGREGALFTSFIFLISPYLTYYARYIRHDTPVIVWAVIIFIAILFYLHQKKDKYLWWLAAGMALLFATKEVSFIYIAIFGSFLVVRLLAQIVTSDWIQDKLADLRTPVLVIGLGILMIGAGYVGHVVAAQQETAVEQPQEETNEPFAADPAAAGGETGIEAAENPLDFAMRWIEVAGIGVLSAGLFLAARAMRTQLDQYAEFDLIVLITSIVLPMASPLLPAIIGWNPRDYSINTCMLEGQETMSAVQLALARALNSTCISSFLSSGMVRSGTFLLITLAVGILLGLWWHSRRWIVFAAIFHTIFFVLYTSVFTNMPGWTSGMIGSLGYWLEQHGVQRGNQPEFYYLFVVPLYEFLSLIFALLAVRLWTRRQRLNKIVGYWLTLILLALLGYSLSNWFFNRLNDSAQNMEPNTFAGILIGLLILGGGILVWFFAVRPRLLAKVDNRRSIWPQLQVSDLIGFVPFVTWWMILTWIAYSIAGEKMPWLSTHFVIPMGILTGWYLQQKVNDAGGVKALLARPVLLLMGLTIVLIVAVFLALGPLLLGQIEFGNQQLGNLNQIGRFLGSIIAAGVVLYFWRQIRGQVNPTTGQTALVLGVFAVLSLLTIRFNYMANFPNADYAKEFLVYAHGAPAAKSVVMEQVDELSMRLNGDQTMQVAFGGSGVAWPFTWYLRDYPNRNYFAENPTGDLTNYPIVIVGRTQMDNVDNLLRNTHNYTTHTYLWWPMEEYRQISWNAIFGNPLAPEESRRGLGDSGVRQALWDIFFYRDYTRYQEVFGGTYTAGQWPLRDELRLYIRKDVLANLWDYGVGAVNAEGLTDPYAEGELTLSPEMVINESGVAGAGEGQLSAPRHVAVGPDGRLYVADSGNHRIQVFTADGEFVTAWGSFGTEPGQFNEPWSLTVDDAFVYVADTWNHRVQKFTLDGELRGVFGRSGAPADDPETNGLGLFFGPRDVVLYGEDRLLVTDTGNHRIQVLDREGNFLSQIGSQGGRLGQMFEPVGIGFGPSGDLFLADTWNARIQQFTNDLVPYNEWRVNAWSGNSINNKPYLATDRDGRVYVTDPEGYRVLIFNATGEYIARFGQFGAEMSNFGLPNGIVIDGDDNIYIADAGNHRILKFAAIFAPPPEAEIEQPVEEEAIVEPTEDTEETAVDEETAVEEDAPTDDETDVEPTPTEGG